jgi:hypothetical protein
MNPTWLLAVHDHDPYYVVLRSIWSRIYQFIFKIQILHLYCCNLSPWKYLVVLYWKCVVVWYLVHACQFFGAFLVCWWCRWHHWLLLQLIVLMIKIMRSKVEQGINRQISNWRWCPVIPVRYPLQTVWNSDSPQLRHLFTNHKRFRQEVAISSVVKPSCLQQDIQK